MFRGRGVFVHYTSTFPSMESVEGLAHHRADKPSVRLYFQGSPALRFSPANGHATIFRDQTGLTFGQSVWLRSARTYDLAAAGLRVWRNEPCDGIEAAASALALERSPADERRKAKQNRWPKAKSKDLFLASSAGMPALCSPSQTESF